MKIPHFYGKNDPDTYLEWERKVEHVFDYHNYSDEKKLKLSTIEFTNYALIWWDQLVFIRHRNKERPIDTWEEMKAIMRRRFIPSHYYRELYQQLQCLTQGSKSVEDYYKEMEMTMIKANVEEDREIMVRFLNGLNNEIVNVIELQHYMELEDIVHKAIKVERQLKRKGISKFGAAPYQNSSSTWKSSWSKKDDKPAAKTQKESHKSKESKSNKKKGIESQPKSNHDIKYFCYLGTGRIAVSPRQDTQEGG